MAPCAFGKPAHVLLGIQPTHVDRRPILPAPTFVILLVRAPALRMAGIPLVESDLVNPRREGLADRDPMRGGFTIVPPPVQQRRRAHQERPRRHHHHLGAVRAIAEHRPHRVQLPLLPAVGRGEIRQMADRRLQQADDLDLAVSLHEEPPPAFPDAETTGKPVASGLDLRRGDESRRSGRQR